MTVAASVAIAVASAAATTSRSVPQRPTQIAPPTGVLLGTSVAPREGRSRLEELTYLEGLIGRRFDIDHRYSRWFDPIPTAELRAAIAAGRTLLLNWNALTASGQVVPWNTIASGQHDPWIAARADAFRELGVPVLLAFQHEPEHGRGKHGSVDDYREAWRRVVSIFRERGADNVEWVWVMMAATFRRNAQPPASAYYPGDDVIDWIAADGYNWFGSTHVRNAPWRSFAQIFDSFYQWAAARGKPLMIAEFGVLDDPSDATRRALWFQDVAQTVKRWPAIKALVYYHSRGWWFDSSPTALAAFSALARDPYFERRAPETQSDRGPPTVVITRPRAGAKVRLRRIVLLQAIAWDDTGIKHVEFWVNGRRRCIDKRAPFQCRWRVASRRGSWNTIRAVARDLAGQARWDRIRVRTR